ncbi:polyprenyl synthetase family protein [Streptomyces sp. NPDC094437]|uniref:polyprenyl synthetase family protein n=1 Tax=Streptomyces sp. NPDC094437 TaxID=3366060 RepID=UPI00382A688E
MSTHVTSPTGPPALVAPRTVRSTVLPVIQQQVSALEPTLSRVCRYHLGFTDEHGDPSTGGVGKLTRASLMMAVADGVGLRPQDVQAQAAAVELLHNATLLHDDIADGDDLRRGRPAAWKVFGTGLAIHAGNALQALGVRIVADDAAPGHTEIARSFAEALGLVHAGQARELTLRPGSDDSLAVYEQMVLEKASALLEWSLRTPAMRAGKTENVLAALRDAARHLGIALQISNDVEDIWGDPAATGKPIRGDIRRRNPTFPVLAAMVAGNPAGEKLGQQWHIDSTTDAHLQTLADLTEEAGGRSSAEQLSRSNLETAVEHLERAGLSPTATVELATLFDRIANRTA